MARKACISCGIMPPTIVYATMTKTLCRSCFKLEQKVNKKLVSKMKDIPDVEAPLGWNFIMNEYVLSSVVGKACCDKIFANVHQGALN